MLALVRRKVWRGFAIAFVALLLIVAALSIIAMAWLNPRLTRYIESDSFRAEMEKETANQAHRHLDDGDSGVPREKWPQSHDLARRERSDREV